MTNFVDNKITQRGRKLVLMALAPTDDAGKNVVASEEMEMKLPDTNLPDNSEECQSSASFATNGGLETDCMSNRTNDVSSEVVSRESNSCSASSSGSTCSTCSSDSEDETTVDDEDKDPTFNPHANELDHPSEKYYDLFGNDTSAKRSEKTNVEVNVSSSLESFSISTREQNVQVSPVKKSRKRKLNLDKWQRSKKKKARNSGESYVTNSKKEKGKEKAPRQMKPPCSEKCKLKCHSKFTQLERHYFFSEFWKLGDINKQRQFIANCMSSIQPRYRYIRVGGERKPRGNNHAFFFQHSEQPVRVCKIFFKNTLDINDRTIRTVIEKDQKSTGILVEEDKRGKHGNQRTLDKTIREGIRNFIDNIPKIESHYTRANTSKLYIDGSKSISELHRDYVQECESKNIMKYGNYTLFYRIFTEEFNISFFTPKKDQCDLCFKYQNIDEEEKERIRPAYDLHIKEKELARAEKSADKENLDAEVAVYDLQAVMQMPKGDLSLFYYLSKLNVLNFTIYNLHNNSCHCYVWDESNAGRGVNELGTCVLRYLIEVEKKRGAVDVIFLSDNCGGQQKNRYMIALYLYAVQSLKLKSITHKFLIKGHTQNEGDSAHSLIEREVKRQLKRGPMYTPDAFISAIRNARKTGEPYQVHEMCYEDIYNLKKLEQELGPLNMTKVKMTETKVIQVKKDSPDYLFYKTSYSEEDFTKVRVVQKKKNEAPSNSILLQPAFTCKPKIAANKKKDLLRLLDKSIIPNYYRSFFEAL